MKLGVLSLRISLIPIVIAFIVFLVYFIAPYVLMAGPGFGALFGIIFLPLVLLLLFVIDCVALVIGIAGFFEKNADKISAVCGIILLTVPIALLVTFFVNG